MPKPRRPATLRQVDAEVALLWLTSNHPRIAEACGVEASDFTLPAVRAAFLALLVADSWVEAVDIAPDAAGLLLIELGGLDSWALEDDERFERLAGFATDGLAQ